MGKRIYALILSILAFLLISPNLRGQIIQGELIDSSDDGPLENGLSSEELLTENIYLTVSEYSGWQKIDLSAYNIFMSGDVALSL